jgi:phosphatidylglycerophosphate synthase
MTDPTNPERRPLQTRNARWAIALAAWLARRGVAPNAISIASMVFAAAAGVAFWAVPVQDRLYCQIALLVAAAVGIQLRLLCNLFDGMVAIEGGRRTPTGDLYNEIPDRIADAFILVGVGYSVVSQPFGIELGWACAVLAQMTAYVRALGRSLGAPMLFIGPMAKQHRMAVMTMAAIAAAIFAPWSLAEKILWLGLIVVLAGSVLTVARRILAIARALRK